MAYDPVIQIKNLGFEGLMSESHLCVDCGYDTAPGCPTRKQLEMEITLYGRSPMRFTDRTEMYIVHDKIWARAGMEPYGGCLCIGCLEKRIGRPLKAKDFDPDHEFNMAHLPRSKRLRNILKKLRPSAL